MHRSLIFLKLHFCNNVFPSFGLLNYDLVKNQETTLILKVIILSQIVLNQSRELTKMKVCREFVILRIVHNSFSQMFAKIHNLIHRLPSLRLKLWNNNIAEIMSSPPLPSSSYENEKKPRLPKKAKREKRRVLHIVFLIQVIKTMYLLSRLMHF